MQETEIQRTCPMPAPPQYLQAIKHYNESKERNDYTAYTPNDLFNSFHYLCIAAMCEIPVKAMRNLGEFLCRPRSGKALVSVACTAFIVRYSTG